MATAPSPSACFAASATTALSTPPERATMALSPAFFRNQSTSLFKASILRASQLFHNFCPDLIDRSLDRHLALCCNHLDIFKLRFNVCYSSSCILDDLDTHVEDVVVNSNWHRYYGPRQNNALYFLHSSTKRPGFVEQ